jgi:WD40 repeat protein
MRCPDCDHELQRVGDLWVCPVHEVIDAARLHVAADGEGAFSCAAEPLRIFLSYGHEPPEHVEVAERLKADLETRGHSVWFDVEKLRAPVVWAREIEGAIVNCDKVLLLMSPHSVRRGDPTVAADQPEARDGYCLNEIAKAVEQNKIIVPVMLAWVEQGPPTSICRIQWLDMQDCVPLSAKGSIYAESRFPRLIEALEAGKLDFEGGWARIRKHLEPFDFQIEMERHIADFTGREWLLGRGGEINRWLREQPDSRVFWILGGPGTGKSAIATQLAHRRGDVGAVHFCVHDHSDFINARKAILSIAYQLATHLPAYQAQLQRLALEDEAIKSTYALFRNIISAPLTKISEDPGFHPRPMLVVIDALDEATATDGSNEFARFIAAHWSDVPAWLRLVITSRREPAVISQLSHYDPFLLDTESEENRKDLRQYLNRMLVQISGTPPAPKTVTRIIEKSEGVFLYARVVVEEIRRGHLSLNGVDAFPDGLVEFYQGYFERCFPAAHMSDYKNSVRPVLNVICAQRAPLPLPLLAQATGISDFGLRQDILPQLASFFPIRHGGDDGPATVAPFHKSIIDWLTAEDKTGHYGAYAVDSTTGARALAEVCWSDFQGNAEAMSPYTLRHLPAHLAEVEDRDRLQSLLTDFAFLQAKVSAVGPQPLIEDYDLLEVDRSEPLGLIQGAIMLRANALVREPAQLAYQLHGRLAGADAAEVQRLLAEAVPPGECWLRPVHPCLAPPGGPLLRTLEGHTGYVNSVALHADGCWAVSASADKTLRVWDLDSGACLRTLEGHTGYVRSVALHADARRAVSVGGYEDNTLKVWDLDSGACLRTFEGHTADVNCVALHADGRRVVSASGRTLKVWALDCDACLCTLEGHTHWVESVALHADGRRAVSASRDCTLKVWDLDSGACLDTLEGHTNYVYSVVLHADGRRAVSASLDGTLKVWDLESGTCLHTLEGHTERVTSVALHADGRRAVSASRDGTLKVWDLESSACLHTLEGHTRIVQSVALHADGCRAVSASRDSTLKVWDLDSGVCLRTLEGHTGEVLSVVLHADGRRAVSAAWDSTLKVWELETDACLHTLEGHTNRVRSVALHADGRRAISASWDDTLKVWDLETGACLRTLEGHTERVTSVALHADGCRAVSASWDKTLKVWDLDSGACLDTLEGHASYVYSVALHVDGRRAVSASHDWTLKVWDLDSDACLRTLEGHTQPVWSVALHADGCRAVSGAGAFLGSESEDSTLKVWNLDSGACLRTLKGHTETVTSVALHADGRRAVSASRDRTLKVWDLDSGACLRTLEGHTDDVNSIALHADGRRAVSASRDDTLKVWDLETGQELASFAGDAEMRSCALTSDGGTVVAGDSVGHMYFLRLEDGNASV